MLICDLQFLSVGQGRIQKMLTERTLQLHHMAVTYYFVFSVNLRTTVWVIGNRENNFICILLETPWKSIFWMHTMGQQCFRAKPKLFLSGNSNKQKVVRRYNWSIHIFMQISNQIDFISTNSEAARVKNAEKFANLKHCLNINTLK